jgi:hypothetical protein
MQMLHSFNTRALEKLALQEEERLDRGATEELPVEDAEGGRGTALLSHYRTDEDIAPGREEEEEKEKESAASAPDASDSEERMEGEEEQEEEEEEEDSGGEEEEEKGEQEKEGAEDRVGREQAFITSYIATHKITAGYKWVEWKTAALENAIMQAGLRTQVGNMKEMIRARVGAAQSSV